MTGSEITAPLAAPTPPPPAPSPLPRPYGIPMIVRSMIWSLSIKSLRTLEPPHTRKFPRVNAQDSKFGPIQPWDVKDFFNGAKLAVVRPN